MIAMWGFFAWSLDFVIINSKERERKKGLQNSQKHADELQTGTQCVIKIKYGT